jgi:hypothetical protein
VALRRAAELCSSRVGRGEGLLTSTLSSDSFDLRSVIRQMCSRMSCHMAFCVSQEEPAPSRGALELPEASRERGTRSIANEAWLRSASTRGRSRPALSHCAH